jgi:hypothetical protein
MAASAPFLTARTARPHLDGAAAEASRARQLEADGVPDRAAPASPARSTRIGSTSCAGAPSSTVPSSSAAHGAKRMPLLENQLA